jgi:hypothetical protein
VRGDMDAFLLDLLEDRIFTARDFGELPNGVCRIAAPLTHELALTLPHWRGLVQPIAARLAQLFRNAATAKNARRPAPVKSPLLATLHEASQPRPYASKAWATPSLETLPKRAAACELCDGPVLKRRRRHCDACIPKVRRAHGLRVIEAARKALALQAAEGNDPRASDRAGHKRGEANAEQHRRNREWMRGQTTADRDEAWFLLEVVPRRLVAKPNRQGDGAIARGVLAHSRRSARPASEALGRAPRAFARWTRVKAWRREKGHARLTVPALLIRQCS